MAPPSRFTVKGSGQVTCGNLYARGTVDDDAVALLELVKHSGNSKFRVKQNGRTTVWSTSSVPFEILNATTGNEMLELMNTGQLRIRAQPCVGRGSSDHEHCERQGVFGG